MRKTRYINISVPEGLAEAIDEYIENNPKLDLRSRAQVVNFALRKLFEGKN
jgi:metal-responsive CopG/Arc/MetJ family transcriptional regulator